MACGDIEPALLLTVGAACQDSKDNITCSVSAAIPVSITSDLCFGGVLGIVEESSRLTASVDASSKEALEAHQC